MELSNRLKGVADMVPKGTVAADIGCDHGYVSIYLIEQSVCDKVIAMDVREGPLFQAVKNIKQHNLESYIETRLSDGMQKLSKGEADAAILAGMGGQLTKRILTQGIEQIGRLPFLVLQPQSEIEKVRFFLRKSGYKIINENMIFEDGKYYPMMLAKLADEKEANKSDEFHTLVGSSNLAQEYTLEDYYGPILLQNKHHILKRYLEFEKDVTSRNLDSLLKCAVTKQVQKEKAMRKKLSDISECLSLF